MNYFKLALIILVNISDNQYLCNNFNYIELVQTEDFVFLISYCWNSPHES